ncbi:MAG: 50S ribosomal protein L9 [Planctomycetota bacterium]
MAKRNIEVLLTRNVFKLGLMGDLVKVKPGYARNFLFPSGSAIPADKAAKRQIEILQERASQQQAVLKEDAQQRAKRMQGLTIEVAANVSHDDRLFGSVGIRDIVAALGERGYEITSNQVALHENIRQLGVYTIRLQLFADVETEITLKVVNANPQAELDDILKSEEESAAAE